MWVNISKTFEQWMKEAKEIANKACVKPVIETEKEREIRTLVCETAKDAYYEARDLIRRLEEEAREREK